MDKGVAAVEEAGTTDKKALASHWDGWWTGGHESEALLDEENYF